MIMAQRPLQDRKHSLPHTTSPLQTIGSNRSPSLRATLTHYDHGRRRRRVYWFRWTVNTLIGGVAAGCDSTYRSPRGKRYATAHAVMVVVMATTYCSVRGHNVLAHSSIVMAAGIGLVPNKAPDVAPRKIAHRAHLLAVRLTFLSVSSASVPVRGVSVPVCEEGH